MADLFNKTIAAAISDITAHGFDGTARVEYWVGRIREAALASLIPGHVLEERLRDTMRTIYRRAVENGGLREFHRGIARFTIERVAPQLRAELDRRIMASANLIKRNRAEAIETTLRRFEGWATSIPAGGSEAVDRVDTKQDIRKALSQLPFEERRVLIDQGQKFTAALSETLALGGGAIGGIWRSRWRQAGYDYRTDHKDRDGRIFLVRGNWAMQRGLVKKAGALYIDELTRPGEEVFCRCKYEWVYNLRDLPGEMLTDKGRDALAAVRVQVENVLDGGAAEPVAKPKVRKPEPVAKSDAQVSERNDEDEADFVKANVRQRPGSRVRSSDVYGRYCKWATERGRAPVSPKSLAATIKNSGFASKHSNGIWWMDAECVGNPSNVEAAAVGALS